MSGNDTSFGCPDLGPLEDNLGGKSGAETGIAWEGKPSKAFED